ncbi:MAG: LytTR family transcriptional regulator DNA-binding domain-containing protein [Candidatus Odinarchaeota archaeon]
MTENLFCIKIGRNEYKSIHINDIVYFKADNSYTSIITSDGKELVISRPLSDFEECVHLRNFIRINRSIIINTAFISYMKLGNNPKIQTFNGETFKPSKSYLDNIKQFIKKHEN